MEQGYEVTAYKAHSIQWELPSFIASTFNPSPLPKWAYCMYDSHSRTNFLSYKSDQTESIDAEYAWNVDVEYKYQIETNKNIKNL